MISKLVAPGKRFFPIASCKFILNMIKKRLTKGNSYELFEIVFQFLLRETLARKDSKSKRIINMLTLSIRTKCEKILFTVGNQNGSIKGSKFQELFLEDLVSASKWIAMFQQ